MDLISKYELIEKIVNTTDETVLWQVNQLLNVESLEELDIRLKTALDKSIKQADNGNLIPHKKAMADIKKKYLKK